jgi:hypothetical protein
MGVEMGKMLAVFLAGMAFPRVAWWVFAMVHDYIYMPLWWTLRHRRKVAKMFPHPHDHVPEKE